MKIIAVLDGRTNATSDSHEFHAADRPALWPSSVRAITYVIATLDPAGDRFVAHAIDVDGQGRGLFSIEGRLPSLAGLLRAIAHEIETRCTGVLHGNPPQPHPGDPPALEFLPGPGRHHPVIGFAMIRQQVIESFQQLQEPGDASRWT